MPDTLVRTTGFAGAAVVVLATGVWLTRSGWPFGAALLNVHKLIALVAIVILGVLVYHTARVAPLSTTDWAIVISAGALCVASFATGVVVSAMESAPTWVLWLHRVGTWFAVGAAALCLVRVV